MTHRAAERAACTGAGAIAALWRIAVCRRTGLWAGLAVVRKHGRVRMIVFTVLAVRAGRAQLADSARDRCKRVRLEAMASLIAMFTLGQLPIGPSIGPAAAALISGEHGIAATAAGVLLTVTGVAGSPCHAT